MISKKTLLTMIIAGGVGYGLGGIIESNKSSTSNNSKENPQTEDKRTTNNNDFYISGVVKDESFIKGYIPRPGVPILLGSVVDYTFSLETNYGLKNVMIPSQTNNSDLESLIEKGDSVTLRLNKPSQKLEDKSYTINRDQIINIK